MKKTTLALFIVALSGILSYSCNRSQDEAWPGDQDHLIMSVLWFQKSAEMRALFLQGYNIASERLAEAAAVKNGGRPLAVVADLDETILDNSPYEAWQVHTGKGFSDDNWKKWTDRGEAKALPGALEFTILAESLGVEMFYVSNRAVDDAFETTLENLRNLGFPFADSAHLLLKTTTSSKIERRNRILETHDIILLLGDNLADVDVVFESRERNLGFNDVDSLTSLFGSRYIIFPNPMYGSFERPALVPDENITTRQRYMRSLVGY
ncbi:MAG: 5'-nucleotidase, lipoprotein e(P4) family [Bacteroidales bacterium]